MCNTSPHATLAATVVLKIAFDTDAPQYQLGEEPFEVSPRAVTTKTRALRPHMTEAYTRSSTLLCSVRCSSCY